MRGVLRVAAVWTACVALILGSAAPSLGQAAFVTSYNTTDFSGEWTEIAHEIGFTADLYDYSGLPFNDAGRMRADTGDISDWSIPEFVCRPHPGIYNWYYGGGLRITKENDPISRELTAYHIQFFRAPDRPVYMDGRPHPPEWAPHTWAGFSTGKFDGNTLVITTTHMKESYIRANTAVFSEKATATEFLTLDGDIMTVTTYLVNHLRVPGLPKPQNLEYLAQVEATFLPYGGKWLVLDGDVEVLEGAWPGSVVLMEFPDRATAKRWYTSPAYQDTLAPPPSSYQSKRNE